jgi:hypothetical protein
MVTGAALGYVALQRLRATWPRYYGVACALVGLWFLPLYAVNAIAGGLLFLLLRTAGTPYGPLVLAVVAVWLLVFDVAWIVDRRRRFLRSVA